jgi:hypothetical protein
MSDPGARYIEVVKDQLHLLGDKILLEDIDILCKYVVLRFLKTSVTIHTGISEDEVADKLQAFVKDIYPFLVTFVTIVNSGAVSKKAGDA